MKACFGCGGSKRKRYLQENKPQQHQTPVNNNVNTFNQQNQYSQPLSNHPKNQNAFDQNAHNPNTYNQNNFNQNTYNKTVDPPTTIVPLTSNGMDANQQQQANLMNLLGEHVVKNYSGWAEEKPNKVDELGETVFIQQIGSQIVRNRKNAFIGNNGSTQNNPNTNPNPYQLWELAGRAIGQSNQRQNTFSILELPIKSLFQLNPIFGKQTQFSTFPSPFIRYKIIPLLDEKKTLDVTSVNDPKNNFKRNNPIIYDYHGGPNQLFYLKQEQGGQVFIINIARGFALKSVSNDANTTVIADPRIDKKSQKWILKPSNNGAYEIISASNDLVLDLQQGKSSNGTAVIVSIRNGQKSQLWRIVPA